MKHIIYSALTSILLICCAGCKTTEQAELSGPQLLHRNYAAIKHAGGIASIGTGKSKRLSSALDIAVSNGQTKLASVIGSRIDSIRLNFSKEVGEDNIDKFSELFAKAKDTALGPKLNNTIPKNICYDTTNGITTAYAFMILDPEIVSESFPSDSAHFSHVYTRFRASDAYAQMNDELKQYGIWKKETGSAFLQ